MTPLLFKRVRCCDFLALRTFFTLTFAERGLEEGLALLSVSLMIIADWKSCVVLRDGSLPSLSRQNGLERRTGGRVAEPTREGERRERAEERVRSHTWREHEP